MIDANSQFFATLTNVGMAKQANADALGLPWKFTEMGVGDANNTDPIPSATQTQLINEWRRRPLNQVRVDPVNPAVIIAEQIIPADEGGHWIREIGLYDADGDLVAVANCAPSFKPVLSQGSGRTQVVRMNFIVSSTGNITLKIDPSVVLATREYVDNKILEELYKLDSKQSVRVATTANIALAGLQTIDAVALVAGDRVLVKNQTVAKDNGIYIAAAPAWVRAPDADTNAEVTSALLVSVEQGATLADTRWQLVTDGVIVLGTTALTFQNVTQGFAPINSPALISPTANTPGQFDSSQLLINSAFLKRAGVEYSNLSSVGVSTVLTGASIGGVVSASSATPINVTLPPTAGVPSGATVEVANAGGGGLVTILPSGTDVLTAQSGVIVPVVLGAGDNAYFVKVTGEWRLRGGSIALKYAAVMSGPNWITPPQFDVSQKLATAEFVRLSAGNLGDVRIYNVSASMIVADFGRIILANAGGPITLTLPPVGGGVLVGSTIHIRNVGGAPLTVVPPAGGSMSVIATVPIPSIVVNTGSSLELTVQGTNYYLAGSGSLKHISDFAASLTGPTCTQRLPSGEIEQWGLYVGAASGADVVITLPVAMLAVPTGIDLTFANFSTGENVGLAPVLQSRASTLGTITVRNLHNAAASFFWKVKGRV
ncbi:phage tail protein [Pseudomonas farris]